MLCSINKDSTSLSYLWWPRAAIGKKKTNNKQTNKEKYYVFSKNSVYKKIINKLNLLKLLKKYSEAKLL